MIVAVSDAQLGMDVYDNAEKKIGIINEIYNAPDREEGEHLYMQVTEGSVLEFWSKNLYVPFSAIVDLVPGQLVTLDCSAADAQKRFGSKPEFLR